MKKMWQLPVAMLIGVILALGPSACGTDNNKDLKNVRNVKPDSIVNIENMDGHPNLGVLCYHGVAIITSTRSASSAAWRLVPALDKDCPKS